MFSGFPVGVFFRLDPSAGCSRHTYQRSAGGNQRYTNSGRGGSIPSLLMKEEKSKETPTSESKKFFFPNASHLLKSPNFRPKAFREGEILGHIFVTKTKFLSHQIGVFKFCTPKTIGVQS